MNPPVRPVALHPPVLRGELDGAVPVLHEDVAHAPLPQPRVEDLCMRADSLPVRSTKSSMGGRVLLVVVVVVYAICFST
jgi:hypothetical protein